MSDKFGISVLAIEFHSSDHKIMSFKSEQNFLHAQQEIAPAIMTPYIFVTQNVSARA